MNLADLRATLIDWLNEVKTWGEHTEQDWMDYITYYDEVQGRLMFHLYTDHYCYHLAAHLPYDDRNDAGSLLLSGWTRKPRAGEDWSRGNDLHDGDFSHETFVRCMLDIVKWELVAKAKPCKPVADDGIFVTTEGSSTKEPIYQK